LNDKKHSKQPYTSPDCKYVMTATEGTFKTMRRYYGMLPANLIKSGFATQRGARKSKPDDDFGFELKKVPL